MKKNNWKINKTEVGILKYHEKESVCMYVCVCVCVCVRVYVWKKMGV